MSLVAYESSGEESEGEEVSVLQGKGPRTLEENEHDKGIDETSSNKSSSVGSTEKPVKSIFSFLPPPKKRSVDLIIDEEDEIPLKKNEMAKFTDELEPIKGVLKDASVTGQPERKSTKLDLPKPKRSDEKQKLKIALPSLPDNDSDSDDEGPKKKIVKPGGKGGSGLLGCLPQPKVGASSSKPHTIQLNQGKPKKLLIPYTLSKKKEEKSSQDKKLDVKDNESDSDDDSVSQSFFSFGEKGSIPSVNVSQSDDRPIIIDSKKPVASNGISKGASFIETETTNRKEVTSSGSSASPYKPKKVAERSKEPETGPYVSIPVKSQDADVSVTGPYGDSSVVGPYGDSSVVGPYGDSSVVGPYRGEKSHYEYGSYSSYSGVSSNSHSSNLLSGNATSNPGSSAHGQIGLGVYQNFAQDQGQKAYLNPQPDYHGYQSGYDQMSTVMQNESIDSDQLRRLQGKRERQIQEAEIIDICGDEMKFDESTVLKNITEESSFRPQLSKNDMPSGQQRRKHQITYLAFQAKEREAELRKNWAANLQTKQQTQQKYGF